MLSRIYISIFGIFALCALALTGTLQLQAAGKSGERRLAIYNIHTEETLDIVYMRDGKRIPQAVERINWIMRDYRENEPTKIDPKLIDLMWEIHTELGSREPIHLISGYRSKKTNAMLRRTRGGQGKKSRHMYGKAADIHFPDVPVKRLRYSALIRQRGGVGYYPTSGLPFVHVDTGRVRHWPRMPRYELALLFPNGRTKHQPRGGGRITKRDVRIARAKHKDLSHQVAAFFDARGHPAPPRPTRVAAAVRSEFRTHVTFASPAPAQPKPQPATSQPGNLKIASLGRVTLPPPSLATRPALAIRPQPAPQLAMTPRLAERPSTFKPTTPSTSDRAKLTQLFTLAALVPAAKKLFVQLTGPANNQNAATENQTASAPAPTAATASGATETSTASAARPALTIAALLARDQPPTSKQDAPPAPRQATTPQRLALASSSQMPAGPVDRNGWATGWVTAPAYDEEHPEELHYRPFPLAPLMTHTASPHDPALAKLVHPDVAETLAFINDDLSALPMKLRPAKQLAASMWSHSFTTSTAGLKTAAAKPITAPEPDIASRPVRTSVQ